MLDWLDTNYEAIKEFYGDNFVYTVNNMVALYPETANTQEDFDRMNNFYTTHKGELGKHNITLIAFKIFCNSVCPYVSYCQKMLLIDFQ